VFILPHPYQVRDTFGESLASFCSLLPVKAITVSTNWANERLKYFSVVNNFNHN